MTLKETAAPSMCIPCRTTYTCGGMYKCGNVLKCVNEHFKHVCGHNFFGPVVYSEDGTWGSTSCTRCGAIQMYHDTEFGP